MQKHLLKLLGLAFVIFISSCTVAKRQYSRGFYFDWNLPSKNAALESAEKSLASPAYAINVPIPVESNFLDTLHVNALPKTFAASQDTVVPPKVDSTRTNMDYVRAEENKIQMEQTATELTKSANRNVLGFFATVFGGIIAATLLTGGVLVILGILLLALLIISFISNIRLVNKIEDFEKRYAEFSNEVKFQNLHRVSGFNHFILALCALGVLLTLIAGLILVLAIAAMV